MELSLHLQTWQLIVAYKRADVLAWHTPNGEKRSKRVAAKLKAMGVVPGVADFTFVIAGMAIFLELKDGKRGRQDDGQEAFQMNAEASGASYHIARTIDDVCRILNEIGALRVRLTTNLLSGVCGGPGAQPGAAVPARRSPSPRRTEATA